MRGIKDNLKNVLLRCTPVLVNNKLIFVDSQK